MLTVKGGKLGPLPFDPETLTQYASVRTWLSSVSSEHTGSSRTRELYLWYFTRWVAWSRKDPDVLKNERLEQLRNADYDYVECRYGSQAYRHALMEGYTLMDNGDGDRRTLMKRKDAKQ